MSKSILACLLFFSDDSRVERWARRFVGSLRGGLSPTPSPPLPTASFISPLLNIYNAQYILQLTFGSSTHQTFTVIPDSGSFDLWIPSVECQDECPPHIDSRIGSFALPFTRQLYNLSLSPSGLSSGERKAFAYGDGTKVDTLGTIDDLCISGTSVTSQAQESQECLRTSEVAFQRAIKFVSPKHSFLLADGLLGLAQNAKSVMGRLFSDKPNIEPIISFYLSYFNRRTLPSGTTMPPIGSAEWELWSERIWKKQRSALVVGDPLYGRFASKNSPVRISKSPYEVQDKSHWLATVRSIGLKHSSFDYVFLQDEAAMMDSGTSLIVLQPAIFYAFAQQLSPICRVVRNKELEEVIVCPCRSSWVNRAQHFFLGIDRMPTLHFTFLSATDEPFDVCLSSKDLILQDVTTSRQSCRIALQKGSPSLPYPIILGNVFMRAYYTSYNYKNHTVQFVRSNLAPDFDESECPIIKPSSQDMSTRFIVACIECLIPLIAFGTVSVLLVKVVDWNEIKRRAHKLSAELGLSEDKSAASLELEHLLKELPSPRNFDTSSADTTHVYTLHHLGNNQYDLTCTPSSRLEGTTPSSIDAAWVGLHLAMPKRHRFRSGSTGSHEVTGSDLAEVVITRSASWQEDDTLGVRSP